MSVPYYIPKDSVPIPPADAQVFTTCCDYCIVACGYKVYRWPLGKEGGPKASQNAYGVDFPVDANSGFWAASNNHNIVAVNGKPHNVIVLADADTEAVNLEGDHSIRGGCIAQKCYNPSSPTRDRLQRPMVRIYDTLMPVSWDFALDIAAATTKHVLKKYGEHAFGVKTMSYQFMENLYAITRFSLRHISTPSFAWHDAPTSGNESPGFAFAGFKTFGPSYWDRKNADVLFISGTDPFETKTILWNRWIMPGIKRKKNPLKVIMVLPRRTAGAAFAEKNGGLWLDLYPGSDAALYMAITRILVENDWVDKEFIKKWTNSKWDSESGFGRGTRNTPWQWVTTWGKLLARDYGDFKKWLINQKESDINVASKISGVSKEKIRKAAAMLKNPGGKRKISFAYEKGNYWSNSYLNTASLTAMALVTGCGNRPGRVIGRLGGHQRGGLGGGSYPRNKSPHKHPGRRRQAMDMDRYFKAGKLRMAWVVGTTWTSAMSGSQVLMNTFRRLVTSNPHQVTSLVKEDIIETLKKRIDSGGTVVVNQDIYLRDPIGAKYADIVFPVATWGEHDFIRANGERRIRLYSKFYDPPGESKPDWWIVSRWAKKMGWEGYDWESSSDVASEGARFSRGRQDNNFDSLNWMAKKKGMKVHDLLRKFGTTGIQTPIALVPEHWEDKRPGTEALMASEMKDSPLIRADGEKLHGTLRLHDSEGTMPLGESKRFLAKKWMYAFNSHTGKALFLKSPWDIYSGFYEAISPKGDELWITNGRMNEIWQSGFDDVERRPYITQRFPEQFIEMHPDDAKARGIESGDQVVAWSHRVPSWGTNIQGVTGGQNLYENLNKAGQNKETSASYTAVAIVVSHIKKGVAFSNFLSPTQPSNSISPAVTDPISQQYRYKLGV